MTQWTLNTRHDAADDEHQKRERECEKLKMFFSAFIGTWKTISLWGAIFISRICFKLKKLSVLRRARERLSIFSHRCDKTKDHSISKLWNASKEIWSFCVLFHYKVVKFINLLQQTNNKNIKFKLIIILRNWVIKDQSSMFFKWSGNWFVLSRFIIQINKVLSYLHFDYNLRRLTSGEYKKVMNGDVAFCGVAGWVSSPSGNQL